MPAVYGQTSTYSNTNLNSNRISIEDLVGKYPAKKFPLLNRLGGKIFEKDVDNVKYQWKEENLRGTKDVLNGAVSSTSATTIVATNAGIFYVDDVALIDAEYVIVTAVAADGVTLTVKRGWNSTGATHSNGATIYRVGVAAPEGADADGAVMQPLSDLYNLTQIFEDVVQMSGTELESFLYRTSDGKDNASNQITKKQQELMEMLQNALLLGTRFDDGVSRRTMGGLKYMIDTYGDPNTVITMGGASDWTTQSTYMPSVVSQQYTVAQEKLDTLIQTLVYNRATPTAIYVGYKAMRRIIGWGVGSIKTDRKDDTRGYQVPATYLSQAGDLDLVQLPGDALNDLIFVVDESRIGYKAFHNRGWGTELLAKTGDSSKWQVLGEYTFKMSTPKIAGYMKGLGL